MELTKLSVEALIAAGASRPTGRSLAQGQYTAGLALADPEVLKKVKREYVGLLQDVLVQLGARVGQRAASQDERGSATERLGQTRHELKDWFRDCADLADELASAGESVPRGLERATPEADTFDGWRQAGLARVGLLDALQPADEAAKAEVAELAARGRGLLAELGEKDSAQELLGSALPQETRELYRLRGLVYHAVKRINALAQRVHRKNRAQAARYNMSLLYGDAGRDAGKPAAPQPSATPPAAPQPGAMQPGA